MSAYVYPPLEDQSCKCCRYNVEGHCHRSAPRAQWYVIGFDRTVRATWPMVYDHDWCGEWCGLQ